MAPLVASLPLLRAVGQVGATYVVAEGPEGMYLIDQHAAHERVLYERLLSKPAGQAEVQGFLEPAPVDLAPHQEQALHAFAEALTEQGYAIEPFGGRAHLLRAAPPCSRPRMRAGPAELRHAVARRRCRRPTGAGGRIMACHGAIRAGQTLSPEEMRELVQPEETQSPHTCPHGRL
jgi:DNA mismatch repair protein MutL